MYHFDFFFPTKVLFGPGRLNDLHLQTLPGTRALLVTSRGRSVRTYGYLDRTQRELEAAGVRFTLFDEVRSNPTRQNVMDGARLARAAGCDFVLALGGGSVMDCAKCIALMAANPGDLWDYAQSAAGGKRQPTAQALPIVCITTSAGTGSEVDECAVISNDDVREKTDVSFPCMIPTLSIVDCELMVSVPPRFTAYQGMDAFFHASETVLNKNVHPMAEMFALKAISLLAQHLPAACRNGQDLEARGGVALANTLAGYYMMCTSAHTMEHVMGSFHPDLVHGAGLIEIAHAYYDFFAQRRAAEAPMRKMAQAMGVSDPVSGRDFVHALDALIDAVGCADLKMSSEGISYAELSQYPRKVHEVLGGDNGADPLPLSDADYLDIFQCAYR